MVATLLGTVLAGQLSSADLIAEADRAMKALGVGRSFQGAEVRSTPTTSGGLSFEVRKGAYLFTKQIPSYDRAWVDASPIPDSRAQPLPNEAGWKRCELALKQLMPGERFLRIEATVGDLGGNRQASGGTHRYVFGTLDPLQRPSVLGNFAVFAFHPGSKSFRGAQWRSGWTFSSHNPKLSSKQAERAAMARLTSNLGATKELAVEASRLEYRFSTRRPDARSRSTTTRIVPLAYTVRIRQTAGKNVVATYDAIVDAQTGEIKNLWRSDERISRN